MRDGARESSFKSMCSPWRNDIQRFIGTAKRSACVHDGVGLLSQDADEQQLGAIQMRKRLVISTMLLLLPSLLIAQTPDANRHEVAAKPCQLISANPTDFSPFRLD